MGTRTILAIVGAVIIAILGALFFGGPIVAYWKQQTADAKAGEEHATDDSAARGLEVTGTKELGDAASDLQTAAATMRSAAHALDNQARSDPASVGELPPSMLDRLHAGDEQLCSSGVKCPEAGPTAAP